MISLRRSRIVALVSLSLGATLAGNAANQPAAPAPAGSKHFLWRATDVPVPFYVLGSVHALRAKDYPLGQAVDQAIGECKRFVFEIDPKHIDYDAYQRKLRDAAQYPHGVTLRQKVSPKTYEYVQKIAKTRASNYEGLKPWAIAMFMYGHPDVHDIFGHWGVESYIQRKASGMAEYAGLESVDEHIGVLSGMSDIESEVFLLQSLAYGDRDVKQFPAVVAAWKRGDLHGVAVADYQQEKEAPYIVQRMITKRNANWIPKIEGEMHTGKPTMIVVGARHLCGPYNVIDLLRAHGHKLEQL